MQFLGPKWPIFPNENFFRKPVNKPCFFHSCLSKSPKIKFTYSSITEILTIREYWNLTGSEPFLAITWEPDISQACSFCRMLMNHRNFHFTKIPDKTNDIIFLKSPLKMFLCRLCFGHFWLIKIFSKKSHCNLQLYRGP